MNHIVLENKLRSRVRKRRIVEIILCIVFLITSLIFMIAYEQSKVIDEIEWGPIKHQSVTYDHDLAWGILIGWLGFIPSVTSLIADHIFSKLVTTEVNGDHITFYRGFVHTNLYVNGEYKDGLSLFGYYLEATLSDGTKVNVALGKWSAHLTFSNGQPPIDV